MSNYHPGDNDQMSRLRAQVEETVSQIAELDERRQANRWTGLEDMDALLGHPSPGEVFVVAGGEHQAAAQDFGLSIAANVALGGAEVAVLSTTPHRDTPHSRLESLWGRVPLERLRNGELTEIDQKRLKGANLLLEASPITLHPLESMELGDVVAAIREIERTKPNTSLVVLESLPLSGPSHKQPVDAYEAVMNAVRDLAAEHGLIIMLLTTFSEREIADRSNKRPMISDLEPNLSLVSHASRLLLLFDESRWDSLSPREGLLEVIIARNQFGPVGTFPCTYRPEYGRVEAYHAPSTSWDYCHWT